MLWTGSPTGALIEYDLHSGRAGAHGVLGGCPVTALCATAGGDLIVATGGGEVALVAVTAGHQTPPAAGAAAARAAAFLAGTDGEGLGSQCTWQPPPPPPRQASPGPQARPRPTAG